MPTNPPKTASCEDIAADWLVRSDRGLTASEERELAGWLASNPRHEEAFLALEETWHRMGGATPVPVAPGVARRTRWRVPLVLAAAATVAVAGVVGWRTWQANYAGYQLAASTDVGGLREIGLPDGSRVQLNTDSAVSISYSRQERRIELTRGEAHFAVARNRQRPFVVSAAGVRVRAVGTAFDVRLREQAVEVLVTEGRVRLASAAEPAVTATALVHAETTEVSAGERAIVPIRRPDAVPAAQVVEAVPATALRQALSWQEKRLDFDGTPLGEMVAEINRYSTEKLVVEDPKLRAERFGGSFPAGDTDTVVRMLVQNFDITAERHGGTIVLRARPTAH